MHSERGKVLPMFRNYSINYRAKPSFSILAQIRKGTFVIGYVLSLSLFAPRVNTIKRSITKKEKRMPQNSVFRQRWHEKPAALLDDCRSGLKCERPPERRLQESTEPKEVLCRARGSAIFFLLQTHEFPAVDCNGRCLQRFAGKRVYVHGGVCQMSGSTELLDNNAKFQ